MPGAEAKYIHEVVSETEIFDSIICFRAVLKTQAYGSSQMLSWTSGWLEVSSIRFMLKLILGK